MAELPASRSCSARSAFRLVVDHGSTDTLGLVLASLNSRCLLSSACPVSRNFASCVEHILRTRCEAHGWRLPKSSRLASTSEFRWRALFAAKTCRECAGAPGDFAIRRGKHEHPLFYLCGRCCKAPAVVAKLQARKLTLDVTGLSGKPLYTRRGDSFAASVSASSEDALATASGARAERQRRSGRGR